MENLRTDGSNYTVSRCNCSRIINSYYTHHFENEYERIFRIMETGG